MQLFSFEDEYAKLKTEYRQMYTTSDNFPREASEIITYFVDDADTVICMCAYEEQLRWIVPAPLAAAADRQTLLHREEDKPAIITHDLNEWWLHGALHRLYAPAIIHEDHTRNEWHVQGKQLEPDSLSAYFDNPLEPTIAEIIHYKLTKP